MCTHVAQHSGHKRGLRIPQQHRCHRCFLNHQCDLYNQNSVISKMFHKWTHRAHSFLTPTFFFSLNIISLKSVPIIRASIVYFFLLLRAFQDIKVPQFHHSSTEVHLSYFQLSVITNKIIINLSFYFSGISAYEYNCCSGEVYFECFLTKC